MFAFKFDKSKLSNTTVDTAFQVTQKLMFCVTQKIDHCKSII